MFGILSKDVRMISDIKFVFLPTFYYYELCIHLFSGGELFNSLLHMNVLCSNTRYIIPWNLFLSPLAALLICALSNCVPFCCCLYVWNFNTSSWQMTNFVNLCIHWCLACKLHSVVLGCKYLSCMEHKMHDLWTCVFTYSQMVS